jgi:hypothetical protein
MDPKKPPAVMSGQCAVRDEQPGDSETAGWGLQMFEQLAPASITRTLREHACLRWNESTCGEWGERSHASVRKRAVLPARMPYALRNMVAVWLRRCALQDGWTERHRSVLSRPIAEHAADLEHAGYGFAPPKTGELSLHRDSEVCGSAFDCV